MKHIAINCISRRMKGRPYTCPGLGDRIHSVLIAYQYAKKHETPVTLHISDDKWSFYKGKRDEGKKQSWKEILDLIPNNMVSIKPWPVSQLSDEKWLEYLKEKDIDADLYHYNDPSDPLPNCNISVLEYLKEPALIVPEDMSEDIDLPKRHITAQWDSTDEGRQGGFWIRQRVESHYKNLGYEIIVVGGEGKGLMNKSLKHIAYVMQKADLHVGADSGFMHMAHLYLPYNKIHIYSEKKLNKHTVPHSYRAVNNGAKYNYLIGK